MRSVVQSLGRRGDDDVCGNGPLGVARARRRCGRVTGQKSTRRRRDGLVCVGGGGGWLYDGGGRVGMVVMEVEVEVVS